MYQFGGDKNGIYVLTCVDKLLFFSYRDQSVVKLSWMGSHECNPFKKRALEFQGPDKYKKISFCWNQTDTLPETNTAPARNLPPNGN